MDTMLVRGFMQAILKQSHRYLGRDLLVSNAIGTTFHEDITYFTTAQNITGLLSVGSVG